MHRLDALDAFIAIADLGGFAAAARRLRVSPAAVTRAVAGLESRFGVALFQRTTRSVRLTDEGAAFLGRCRAALGDLRQAEQDLMGARAEVQGRLTVSAPVMFGRLHVMPILAALLRRHPRLSVELSLIDRVVQLGEEGIDVAVRIGALADSALRVVKVAAVRPVVVGSPAYLDGVGAPSSPLDLKAHAIIAFRGIAAGDEWTFASPGVATPPNGGADTGAARPPPRRSRPGIVVRVAPRLAVNGADAAIAAARDGLGLTRVLSYQVAAELTSGSLRSVLDSYAPAPRPIHLLYRAGASGSPRLRAFVEEARAYFRQAAVA